jgi:hypothetical protein
MKYISIVELHLLFAAVFEIHRFFLDVFHRPTRRFGDWICFRSQVKVGEKTPTQLGPLEKANPVIEISSL